ncbi:MAG TPA: hypothetical protein VJN42_04725 [Candidatus Acidoferrum sp.]|nr:hypothetical protein [Candidatus Acidoferrum sp.]
MYKSVVTLLIGSAALLQTAPADKKQLWKPVEFAIVRFNEAAPQAWNLYHAEKRGVLLLKLWKRYLLLDTKEQEVYEIDPQAVKAQGENVEWALTDLPSDPIEISEWKERSVGLMERIRFRFGKNGHYLDIQIPLKADGKPAY